MNLMGSRRITCAAAVIAFSCIFYGAYSMFMLYRIEHFAARLGPLDPTAPLHEDIENMLPAFEIAMVGSVLPLAFLLYAAHWWVRAWYHRLHGGCPYCGKSLRSWYGRCPHCLERVGPDRQRTYRLHVP